MLPLLLLFLPLSLCALSQRELFRHELDEHFRAAVRQLSVDSPPKGSVAFVQMAEQTVSLQDGADALQGFLSSVAARGGTPDATGGADATKGKIQNLMKNMMPSKIFEPGAMERSMSAAPALFDKTKSADFAGSQRPMDADTLTKILTASGVKPVAPGQPGRPAKPGGEPMNNVGSSLDNIANLIGGLMGPVPSYNGPCQCKGCAMIMKRLMRYMFEWGKFGPKEIQEEIDDRFCFGERWMNRAECYFILGNYRDLIATMMYFGMDEVSICKMVFQCYSGEGLNPASGGASDNYGAATKLTSLPPVNGEANPLNSF